MVCIPPSSQFLLLIEQHWTKKRCGDISLWISDYINYIHLNPNQEPFQSTKINDPTLSNTIQLWLWFWSVHLKPKNQPSKKPSDSKPCMAVTHGDLVHWGSLATSSKTAQERTWPDCSHWTAGAAAVCVCCVASGQLTVSELDSGHFSEKNHL